MGQAKGSGGVARQLHLSKLCLRKCKVERIPLQRRSLHIQFQPCAAVNCYAHAFMNNGFMPDKDELKNFKEDSKNIDPKGKGMYNTFDFEFRGFFSKSQKEKYDQMSKKRTRYVSVRTDKSEIKLKL